MWLQGPDSTQGFRKAKSPLFFPQTPTSPKKKQIGFINRAVTDPRADSFTVESLGVLCDTHPRGGLVKHAAQQA